MNRLPIRHKLTIVVALLLVPIALLGYLFVKQSMKDIAFATKEVEGVQYMEAVWPRLADLAAAGTGASPSTVRGESLAAIQATLDGSLGTAEPSAAFAKALGAVGGASGRSAATVAAIEAGRALVTKVGDGSNLILDPDLDSYYVMDAVVIKLPDALDLGAGLVGLADEQRRKGSLTDDDKLAFVARIAQFESAAAGVIASLDAARKANADGSLARAVDPLAAAYAKAVDGFIPEAKKMAVALRTDPATAGPLAEGLRRSHAEFHARTDALWGMSAKELDRLLGLRIDGFWSTLVTMLGLAVTVAVAALVLAVVLVRSIIGSIDALDRRIRALGDSDIGAPIQGADGADEIAQIARAVAYFRDRTIEKLADANSDERKRALIASERRAMAGIADKVRQSVGAIIAALREVAGAIDGSVVTVARNAEETRTHLGKAIQRLDAASADVSVVVAAVTELSASIGEISSQTAQGASAGSAARERTVAARAVADRLSSSTQRVGEVTSLIADIAGQTNLLALNATIEAARAGEAGRGFAVVASEVKALADQTARATDEIARQIAEIRNASGAVLAAIDDMGVSVGNVTAVTAAIASAVEEQNAATKEISVSLQQATDGTNGAVGAMNQLPVLAGNTEAAAGDLARLSKNLMGQAETLNREIERLLVELTDRRAADRYPADTPVTVMVGSRTHQGMVLDIAVKGMQARVPGGLGTGPVTVRFPDGLVASGAIVWSREDRIGVEFETGILAEAVQRYAATGLAA